MSTVKHLEFSATIHAPVPTVWRLMIGPESYKRWACAFAEGTYFEGSWGQGAKIWFLSPPSGDGMVAEIAQNREGEFISIRHLGVKSHGVEDTTSEAVRAWAPMHEDYSFISVGDGTKLLVELDAPDEWASYMNEAWPRAPALLKRMSEADSAA